MSAVNLARLLAIIEDSETCTHTVPLSSTMLNKSTIDASTPIRELFNNHGYIDFDSVERGQENKQYINCVIVTHEEIIETEASCYRPAAKPNRVQGDPRFWPRRLNSHCRPGDILLIWAGSNLVNVHFIVISGDETFDDLIQNLINLEILSEYPEENENFSLDETLPQHLAHLLSPSDVRETSPLNATEVTLADLLDGQQKFIMPRFQRTFKWGKREFEMLWADIDDLWFGVEEKRFLGALVTRVFTPRVGREYQQNWVIDGQQRITTLYALLLAIVKESENANFEELASDCAGHLFVSGGTFIDEPTITPTVHDSNQFNELIRKIERTKPSPNLQPGFGSNQLLKNGWSKYLQKGVRERCSFRGTLQREALEKLYDIVANKLIFIQIIVPEGMNPNKVFDTLNTVGSALTAADLVRNLIFEKMIDDPDGADRLHRNEMLPFEKRLKKELPDGKVSDRLDDYFFPYALTLGNRKLTKANMFAELRKHWRDHSSEEIVHDLKQLVEPFRALVFSATDIDEGNPLRTNSDVSKHIERLRRLGIPVTTYPYLLKLLKSFESGESSSSNVVKCLQIIEAFQVRRIFCSISSAGYHTLFREMWADCGSDYEKLHDKLTTSTGYEWPDNDMFSTWILSGSLYSKSKFCRYILNEFELSENRQQSDVLNRYDKSTSEHIIPQDISGTDWANIITSEEHNELVHTWGNLTILTSWENPEVGRKIWPEKRIHYLEESIYKSPKKVARDFPEVFDTSAIRVRSEELSTWALTRWPRSF